MEWKTVKLGDCLSKIIDNRGKTPKDLAASGHPLLEINAVSKNNKYPLYGEAKKYVDDVVYSTWFRSGHPQYGDILVPTVGTLGAVAYVDRNDCCIAQNLIALRANADICDNAYIYYLLCNPQIVKRLLNLDIGAVQASIKVPHLLALEISLPPLETQRRIAAILSSLDDKIENNNRINRNLEAQAQALFKSWFVDFEPWGGTMPEDWKKQKLGQIIELYRGVSYSSKDIKEGDYALLSMNNIRPWGGFLYDFSRKFSGRFKEIHKLNPYDLIMCITDITQERRLIGYTALIPPYYDNLIMCTHLLKVTSEKYDSRFLNGLFNYSGLSRFIADCATGTTVLGLTADIVKGIEWTIPTPEAAKKYSNMVIDMYDSIFRNNQESARLAALRDTLLPKLMKGEITL